MDLSQNNDIGIVPFTNNRERPATRVKRRELKNKYGRINSDLTVANASYDIMAKDKTNEVDAIISLKTNFNYLGVEKADPQQYVDQYGRSLAEATNLPELFKYVKPPPGENLAVNFDDLLKSSSKTPQELVAEMNWLSGALSNNVRLRPENSLYPRIESLSKSDSISGEIGQPFSASVNQEKVQQPPLQPPLENDSSIRFLFKNANGNFYANLDNSNLVVKAHADLDEASRLKKIFNTDEFSANNDMKQDNHPRDHDVISQTLRQSPPPLNNWAKAKQDKQSKRRQSLGNSSNCSFYILNDNVAFAPNPEMGYGVKSENLAANSSNIAKSSQVETSIDKNASFLDDLTEETQNDPKKTLKETLNFNEVTVSAGLSQVAEESCQTIIHQNQSDNTSELLDKPMPVESNLKIRSVDKNESKVDTSNLKDKKVSKTKSRTKTTASVYFKRPDDTILNSQSILYKKDEKAITKPPFVQANSFIGSATVYNHPKVPSPSLNSTYTLNPYNNYYVNNNSIPFSAPQDLNGYNSQNFGTKVRSKSLIPHSIGEIDQYINRFNTPVVPHQVNGSALYGSHQNVFNSPRYQSYPNESRGIANNSFFTPNNSIYLSQPDSFIANNKIEKLKMRSESLAPKLMTSTPSISFYGNVNLQTRQSSRSQSRDIATNNSFFTPNNNTSVIVNNQSDQLKMHSEIRSSNAKSSITPVSAYGSVYQQTRPTSQSKSRSVMSNSVYLSKPEMINNQNSNKLKMRSEILMPKTNAPVLSNSFYGNVNQQARQASRSESRGIASNNSFYTPNNNNNNTSVYLTRPESLIANNQSDQLKMRSRSLAPKLQAVSTPFNSFYGNFDQQTRQTFRSESRGISNNSLYASNDSVYWSKPNPTLNSGYFNQYSVPLVNLSIPHYQNQMVNTSNAYYVNNSVPLNNYLPNQIIQPTYAYNYNNVNSNPNISNVHASPYNLSSLNNFENNNRRRPANTNNHIYVNNVTAPLAKAENLYFPKNPILNDRSPRIVSQNQYVNANDMRFLSNHDEGETQVSALIKKLTQKSNSNEKSHKLKSKTTKGQPVSDNLLLNMPITESIGIERKPRRPNHHLISGFYEKLINKPPPNNKYYENSNLDWNVLGNTSSQKYPKNTKDNITQSNLTYYSNSNEGNGYLKNHTNIAWGAGGSVVNNYDEEFIESEQLDNICFKNENKPNYNLKENIYVNNSDKTDVFQKSEKKQDNSVYTRFQNGLEAKDGKKIPDTYLFNDCNVYFQFESEKKSDEIKLKYLSAYRKDSGKNTTVDVVER
jgi:hypothetical protein